MKKHGKAKKGSAARSGKRPHKLARKARKSSKSSVRKMSVSKRASKRAGKVRPQKAVKKSKPASVAVSSQKAADEIPTLEQVTITCANCGRPFKVFKLKGLSLEGTICQRCSLGEMELPESFG